VQIQTTRNDTAAHPPWRRHSWPISFEGFPAKSLKPPYLWSVIGSLIQLSRCCPCAEAPLRVGWRWRSLPTVRPVRNRRWPHPLCARYPASARSQRPRPHGQGQADFDPQHRRAPYSFVCAGLAAAGTLFLSYDRLQCSGSAVARCALKGGKEISGVIVGPLTRLDWGKEFATTTFAERCL